MTELTLAAQETLGKLRWNVPGDFTHCVKEMREHLADPEGYCANLHKKKTGVWPGDKKNLSLETEPTMEQLAAVIDQDDTVEGAEDAEYMGPEWHGVLTVEDTESGDGRMFKGNSLTWADLPLPLMYQPANEGEHKGSVNVGRIDKIERRGKVIYGSGVFDLENPHGREAHRQMRKGFLRGNSVDVDSVKDADVELVFPAGNEVSGTVMDLMKPVQPELTIFNRGRIRGTTLVQFPAFTEATIQLGLEESLPEAEGAVTADGRWNGPSELDTLTAAATNGMISLTWARKTFAYYDRSRVQDGQVPLDACRFLHHTLEDGAPGPANLTACATGIQALNTRAAGLSLAERRAVYAHLAGHIRDAGKEPQAFEEEAPMDELVASGGGCAPSAEWFQDPKLPGPTALQVTADGRVFGHAALWGTCHTSFADTCVSPPREESHDYFRLGEVITADGSRVPVGSITLGTGHAATAGLDPRRAAEHYDNTGTVVADVASGNDEHGIWVAGAVRPDVPAERVRQLSAAKLSGDWRRLGGKLRLVAMLAVNVPGFPVPRMKTHVTAGAQMALVASGVVTDEAVTSFVSEKDRLALAAMRERARKLVGKDAASIRASLRTQVHG
jgi:hypothetical protein